VKKYLNYKLTLIIVMLIMLGFVFVKNSNGFDMFQDKHDRHDHSLLDALVDQNRLEYKKEQQGLQKIHEAGKRFKDWGNSVKIKRIEKALIKLNKWDKENVYKIMEKYDASVEEMNEALANVSILRGYTKNSK